MSFSQTGSQLQSPLWISIRIEKFSHNTTPYGTRKYQWNHMGLRDSLDFTLQDTRISDDYGHYERRLMMKVTSGMDEVELQNIGELVKFTQEFNPSSGAEHPVQVVVKCPCIAMRYPKTVNTVRRIQVRFQNESDFNRVLHLFRELELPITENANAPSSSRPTVSPAVTILSPASTAGSNGALPSLSRPSSSAEALGIRAFDGFPERISSYPRSDSFKIPSRPATASSDAQRPSSELSYGSNHIMKSNSASSTTLPVYTSPLKILAQRHQSVGESSSLYSSRLEGEFSRLTPPPQVNQLMPHRQASLVASQNGARPPLVLESSDPSEAARLLEPSPFFRPQHTLTGIRRSATGSPGDLNRIHMDQMRSALFDTQRPASTPLEQLEQHHIQSMWIPPRRELPFPKPREVDKNRSSSASELPPLPKPTPVKKMTETIPGKIGKDFSSDTSKPVKKRVAKRKITGTKSQEPAEANDIPEEPIPKAVVEKPLGPILQEDQPSPLAAKSAAASRPSSAPSGLQSKTVASKKRPPVVAPSNPLSNTKRPKTIDRGTQTQTISGRDHTTAWRSILTSEPVVQETTTTPRSSSPPESYLNLLDDFIVQHKLRPPPQELWEVPGYAQADEEQRQNILNDFICENLENEDFLQLCQDTENSWRKLGLSNRTN